MPRYYFVVEMLDHTYDDSVGEQFPSDAAAKTYGDRVVRELRQSDFQSADAILHVRDEGGRIIRSIPL
jgi:Domain of unknown function (DUF6894)